MSENKTNFIIAIRGYKVVKKEKSANFTDVTALDNSNNKVLLRIIEPLATEYVCLQDIKNLAELIQRENYVAGIFIGKQFTESALKEMSQQKIEYISEDYMPPFAIEELYQAIVNCANSQCQKKCGKVTLTTTECVEKAAYLCKTKSLTIAAKRHFEDGTVGLLKNDLKIALALTR